MPRAGAPLFDPDKAQRYEPGEVDGDTTGFVVADGRGNVLSVIQSLYKGFGSGVVAPGTGVVLQNRGAYFNTNPDTRTASGPASSPFHTLIACIVTRDGRPVLGLANMGGDGQAMFHTQILTNVLDFGMEIQEAIERPRFFMGRINPGDARGPGAAGEPRARPRARRAAAPPPAHNILPVSDWFTQEGHAHAVAVLKDGVLRGAQTRAETARLCGILGACETSDSSPRSWGWR